MGTAGWSIPSALSDHFEAEGSGLERYARVFSGAEVNSSFYRRHREATWRRWHDAVPDDFRFAVKLPKAISHDLRLHGGEAELDIFLGDVAPLRAKLGPVLVQLPPSLPTDTARDTAFFRELRRRVAGRIVVEPRHRSWAAPYAIAMLSDFGIDRVYADPQLDELRAAVKLDGFVYVRLHGAPRIYYSAYSADQIAAYEQMLSRAATGSWCIFDNTASGAAIGDALELQRLCRR
ncbi:hypothetical protein JP75_09480 [Devosia riboflavina]|uniref:DUF72 domain-containing protein n=1 Tax=Devosia riboflavina TaxID=46914 RepID=A0A087M2M8_9HYPH|nr:DUF72 domain-containing protein [Devosia riboflavina]KFL31131.1 hypothetical protein JP75_09480 [Devosia riboflavina]